MGSETMSRRNDDGIYDAAIAATEHNDFRSSHPLVLRQEHDHLVEAGLLDPGQPTRWSHLTHVREMTAEFTPDERRMIRHQLMASEVTEEPQP